MSLRTTLYLLIVVAILGGLLFFFQDDETTVTEQTLMLVEDLPESANRIDLVLVTGEALSLEKRGDAWWIVRPTLDRADNRVMQQLYEVLMGNRRLEVDANPPPEMLKGLELEPPRARATLMNGEKTLVAIRVGERDPTGSMVHVKLEGDDALYRTGANLSNVLERPMHEYRDKRFLRGDGTLLRRIEVYAPNEAPIVLERPRTDWVMTEPRGFPADNARVNELKALLLLEVLRYVKAKPSADDLQSLGLVDGVATRVVFDWGDRKAEVYFVGQQADDPTVPALARDSERGHVVAVTGRSLLSLFKKAKEYRDPNICNIAMINTRRVRVRIRQRPTIEMLHDSIARRFEFVEPFHDQPVDDSRTGALHAWIRSVSRIGASGFLDLDELPVPDEGQSPWDLLGFDSPQATFEFELIDTAGVSTEIQIEVADADGGGTVPVRRLDRSQDTAYLVPEKEIDELLQVDPRQFLLPDLFPADIIEIKKAVISQAGRSRSLERSPIKGAEYWHDPTDEDLNSSDFQEFLSSLPIHKVYEFLPRDPVQEDGLDDETTAHLDLEIVDRKHGRHTLTVSLGRKDPTGKMVTASSSKFPIRTVFYLPVQVLDDVMKLLE